MSNTKKIVLAIGGSSGSIYAKTLIEKLKQFEHLTVGVVMTDNAKLNWELELGHFDENDIPFKQYSNKDFFAPFASGSAQYDTMIICPCSMGLLARIAGGISDDLITRAADVTLKERRRLILVPRETPYSTIHLRNMLSLSEAGSIICPASPSFYSKPETIQELVDTVVNRVIDLAGLDSRSYRWGEM